MLKTTCVRILGSLTLIEMKYMKSVLFKIWIIECMLARWDARIFLFIAVPWFCGISTSFTFHFSSVIFSLLFYYYCCLFYYYCCLPWVSFFWGIIHLTNNDHIVYCFSELISVGNLLTFISALRLSYGYRTNN